MINFQTVRYTWQGNSEPTLLLDALSIASSEKVFVSGASGSGKSTLLSLLCGLAQPQSGTIIIDGTNICGLGSSQRDKFRADKIGYIFQIFNLVPYLSILDNVMLPCRFSASRKANAINKDGSVEASARRLLSAMGLDDQRLVDKKSALLSVGQQQRVAAARALIGAPPIVIADEPTSSLDADHQKQFIDLLMREVIQASSVLVFVSHDLRLADHFDRIIALDDVNSAVRERGLL